MKAGETPSGLTIPVENAYHPVTNPNRAYVDAIKVDLKNWKDLLNAKDKPSERSER